MRNLLRYCWRLQNHDWIRNFRGRTEKLPYSENIRISSWSYDMEGHAQKCVERYCELANNTTRQLYKVSTPCIDDHHLKEGRIESGRTEKLPYSEIFVFLRGLRIWKVMPRNVWNDIVSWQTRRLDNYKVSAPCIDDHHFKEGRIESGRTEKLPYSENIRISSWS